MSLTAPSAGELAVKVDYVRRLRTELAIGVRSRAEVERDLARLTRPTAIMVSAAYAAYVASATVMSRGAIQSAWRRMLAPYFRGKRGDELDVNAMRAWESRLIDRGYASNTIDRAFDFLNAALRAQRSVIGEIPYGDWKPKRPSARSQREKPLHAGELQKLIDAALAFDVLRWESEEYSDLAARVVVLALLGLRNGEGAALGVDAFDIDREGVEPSVLIQFQAIKQWRKKFPDWERPKYPIKQRRLHPVHCSLDVVAVVRMQIERLKAAGWYRADGPLFPSPKTGTWRELPVTIRPALMRELVAAAGLPNNAAWSTHSLRHGKATIEIASGNNMRDTASVTGHASLAVLERYVRSSRLNIGEAPSPARACFGETSGPATAKTDRITHGTQPEVRDAAAQ